MRSLKRLGLDYVDLYQIHGFDPATPIEETVRALDDVVRSGKARYVGFCNLPAWLAMKALAYAEANGLARFQSAQVYYSIAGRDIEREIVAAARRPRASRSCRGARSPAVCCRASSTPNKAGPRARGARRSTSRRSTASGCRRCSRRSREVAEATAFRSRASRSRGSSRKPVRDERHHRREEPEQLHDNLAATEVKLVRRSSSQLLDEASALPPEYPGWMVDLQNREPRVPRA